jgi:hypothetical protein
MSKNVRDVDNRPLKHLRVLSRGDKRSDGMIFVQYCNDRKNGEWWETPDRFKEISEQARNAKRKYKASDNGRAAQRRYEAKKRKTCPAFRVRKNLRDRIYSAIMSQQTSSSTSSAKLLGCTIPSLMFHLESKFQSGMTWENYGDWHIDHIKPCAAFDLTIEDEQLKCFHYTNLQPLWAKENRMKSDKTTWNIQ